MNPISADDWMGMWDVAARRANAAEAEGKRLTARVVELESEARWIPVGEALPACCDLCLVWDGLDIVKGFYYGSRWLTQPSGGHVGGGGYSGGRIVTHWRQLPKPPKTP